MPKNMKNSRIYYMDIARKLALKARGRTSPNPMVGAVVVKAGRIIGRGYHEKAGLPHAEVIALTQAGKDSKGATLYVTLEPCAHFGQTPPCTDVIIKSKVKEVIIGMVDPNPLNNGRGIKMLLDNKIKVELGVLEEELRAMNEPFIKYIVKKMPFVTVKIAESLDGKIATHTGDSKWITSDISRGYAHRLRGNYDAVMVGVNTVLRDNPKLDAWFSRNNPVKIIVDSQLSTPPNANLFSQNNKTVLVTLPIGPGQTTENRALLSQKARILEVKERAGQINLSDAMKKLARLGIINVLVEGGGTLVGSLFDEGLVDKVIFFISPKIVGGKEAISSVMGKGVSRIDKAIKLRKLRLRRMAEDILVEGYV